MILLLVLFLFSFASFASEEDALLSSMSHTDARLMTAPPPSYASLFLDDGTLRPRPHTFNDDRQHQGGVRLRGNQSAPAVGQDSEVIACAVLSIVYVLFMTFFAYFVNQYLYQ